MMVRVLVATGLGVGAGALMWFGDTPAPLAFARSGVAAILIGGGVWAVWEIWAARRLGKRRKPVKPPSRS